MAVVVRPFRGDAATSLIEQVLKTAGTEAPQSIYVCVGDVIDTQDQEGFLRGHGTQVVNGRLVSTVCGVVERVNKLVYVRTLNSRYTAEQGDVVVGRVAEIAGKAWRIDLKSRQEAKLLLSAVHLPGGVQRRRNAEDERNMRSFFREGDAVFSEVQSIHADGSIALHTRSSKYGKLHKGQLLAVPANLIKRQKQHFHTLDALGIELIIGCNGLVWVGPTRVQLPDSATQEEQEAAVLGQPVTLAQIENVARVANSIRALSKLYMPIYLATIMSVYEAALDAGVALKDIVDPEFLAAIIQMEAEKRSRMES